MREEAGDGFSDLPSIAASTLSVLEGFFMVLDYLMMHGMRHRDDYRVALTKTQVRGGRNVAGAPASRPAFGMWLGKGRTASGAAPPPPEFRHTVTVNFWCLNPAVSFLDLKDSLHSVVLTSGTLSPMASFSTELDVRFPLQLEASHVIDRRQVWIGTLGRGPTGHSLNATFRSAETFGFQVCVDAGFYGLNSNIENFQIFLLCSQRSALYIKVQLYKVLSFIISLIYQ